MSYGSDENELITHCGVWRMLQKRNMSAPFSFGQA